MRTLPLAKALASYSSYNWNTLADSAQASGSAFLFDRRFADETQCLAFASPLDVRSQTVLFAHCYTNDKEVNKYRYSQTIQVFIDTNLETSKSSTSSIDNTGHKNVLVLSRSL